MTNVSLRPTQTMWPAVSVFVALSLAWSCHASNFVRVPIGHEVSIEVPENWVVGSGSLRKTIDTAVEASGHLAKDSSLTFMAPVFDDRGRTMASIGSRYFPENNLTQRDAQQMTAADLRSFDIEMNTAEEAALRAAGVTKIEWLESRLKAINGRYVIVHEHRQSIGNLLPTRVRRLRVWNAPHSFTATISYREQNEAILLPIINRMTQSLRIQAPGP